MQELRHCRPSFEGDRLGQLPVNHLAWCMYVAYVNTYWEHELLCTFAVCWPFLAQTYYAKGLSAQLNS